MTIRHDTLLALVLALLIGASGMKWIPILSIGSIRVEVHNFLVLCLIAYLGYQLFTRRDYIIPTFFWCAAALMIWLSAGLAIHGTINLSPIILTLPVVLASLVLCNFPPQILNNLVLIALFSQGIILLSFLASAVIGGIDLIGGVQHYFLSQDRLDFLLGTVRPLLNAFSNGTSAEVPEYDSWLLNHLSATLYITFCLSLAAQPRSLTQRFALTGSAAISLFFLLTLFSSSTIMALLLAFMIFGLHALMRPHSRLAFWFALAAILLSLTLILPIVAQYFLFNIESDLSSATSRLDQYIGALEGIAENPIFGVGMRVFDTHTVHNLFLASFMMTGIVGGALSGALFVMAIAMSLEGIKALWHGTLRPDLCLLMATLPLIFITRSGLAGGFGLPSNAELFAMATAYLARRLHRQVAAHPIRSTAKGPAPQSGERHAI